MPKPGYTRIIVKSEVRGMLQKLAEAQGYRSINQLLTEWIRVHRGVHPTMIHEENRQSETSLKTGLFPKKQFKFLAGPLGFEPRTSGSAGRRHIPG